MKISVIGSGYVGLVSGACFADFGHHVSCMDISEDRISSLNTGKIPIYEPGLQQLIADNVKEGRLSFTYNLAESIKAAVVVFIAVGTPSRRGDGHADLSYVYAAARSIAHQIDGFTVIVNKSTVPVGTGDEVERIIRKERPDADFEVVSNPEFLREGAAIIDFKHPDRVVVGTESSRAKTVMEAVYRPLYLNQTPIIYTSRRTSELIKYAANAFLATKIAFINEMADLCEKVDANVQEVSHGIGLDGRIGSKFLNAGPGYGGSCFPKDTLALVKTARDSGAPVEIVETVERVNKKRKLAMADKIIEACGGHVSGKSIALLGLAFKPNTDDMRDSPSLDIVPALQAAGAIIRAFDPEAMEEAATLLCGVDYFKDSYSCAEGADALVIVTEWDQFRALSLEKLKATLNTLNIIDLRNIYNPVVMREKGFNYVSIGRR